MRDGSVIHMWSEVYPNHEPDKTQTRIIEVYGTGHEIPHDRGAYIGTVIFENAGLVWHVYDGGEKIEST